jgi:hypothetical protein
MCAKWNTGKMHVYLVSERLLTFTPLAASCMGALDGEQAHQYGMWSFGTQECAGGLIAEVACSCCTSWDLLKVDLVVDL